MAKMGRPPIFETPEQMAEAIDAYFAACDETKEPYTMTGLAIAIGFESRRSLVDYDKKDDFSPTIKKARFYVEEFVEKRMLSSAGVVAGVIFNAKNNFGWRDKQEIEMSGGFEETRDKQKGEYAKLSAIRNNSATTDGAGNSDTPT